MTSLANVQVGGTLMSSMLFNVALMLLACLAVIQFCAQAFSLYAYNTAIYQIFTNQVRNKHASLHDSILSTRTALLILHACKTAVYQISTNQV